MNGGSEAVRLTPGASARGPERLRQAIGVLTDVYGPACRPRRRLRARSRWRPRSSRRWGCSARLWMGMIPRSVFGLRGSSSTCGGATARSFLGNISTRHSAKVPRVPDPGKPRQRARGPACLSIENLTAGPTKPGRAAASGLFWVRDHDTTMVVSLVSSLHVASCRQVICATSGTASTLPPAHMLEDFVQSVSAPPPR